MLELIKTNIARRAIAEAVRVDEVKDILDKAEAVRLYAKRAGLGLEMESDAAEIVIRAERRMGELLAEMPKNHGARGIGPIGIPKKNSNFQPELKDLGISLKQSMIAQQLADVPENELEEHIAQKRAHGGLRPSDAHKFASGVAKTKKRTSLIELSRQSKTEGDAFRLIESSIGNLCDHLLANSIDSIICDPPYEAEYLLVYSSLAVAASKLLKPGAPLAVMIGQYHLPEILALMTPHIKYTWIVSYLTPANTGRVFSAKALVNWKPVLVFSKGHYGGEWYSDTASNSARDKKFHEWGQGESGMMELVKKFSRPGETILDPFCGGSATGAAALRLNRLYIGSDCDPDAIAISAKRLSEVTRA